ncbi:hypothetical protein AMECASPLE_038618 [Ameca splendens]|uniref:Uncharacterized protein n=1 Tax=Ameca splendens TaxID=208324 RepID=A0ABV0XLA2_9TELE
MVLFCESSCLTSGHQKNLCEWVKTNGPAALAEILHLDSFLQFGLVLVPVVPSYLTVRFSRFIWNLSLQILPWQRLWETLWISAPPSHQNQQISLKQETSVHQV